MTENCRYCGALPEMVRVKAGPGYFGFGGKAVRCEIFELSECISCGIKFTTPEQESRNKEIIKSIAGLTFETLMAQIWDLGFSAKHRGQFFRDSLGGFANKLNDEPVFYKVWDEGYWARQRGVAQEDNPYLKEIQK